MHWFGMLAALLFGGVCMLRCLSRSADSSSISLADLNVDGLSIGLACLLFVCASYHVRFCGVHLFWRRGFLLVALMKFDRVRNLAHFQAISLSFLCLNYREMRVELEKHVKA